MWRLVTVSYTPEQKAGVTWEQLSKMLHTEYVPLVERERLYQEYLSLRQTKKPVTEITKMFIERYLFFPMYSASKQA